MLALPHCATFPHYSGVSQIRSDSHIYRVLTIHPGLHHAMFRHCITIFFFLQNRSSSYTPHLSSALNNGSTLFHIPVLFHYFVLYYSPTLYNTQTLKTRSNIYTTYPHYTECPLYIEVPDDLPTLHPGSYTILCIISRPHTL